MQDQAFETTVHEYIEDVISKEKETFRSNLQPFNVHAARIRKELLDSMNEFKNMYQSGYSILINELALEFPSKDPEVDSLDQFRIKDTPAIFKDPMLFMDSLAHGASIYQFFGFTTETIDAFFNVGVKLLKENRFEDAKKVFYFLATIAPKVHLYWLGLAISYVHCKELDKAQKSSEKAVELGPQNPENYVLLIRIYLLMDRARDAKRVCDRALEECREHAEEPWAKSMKAAIEGIKRSI